MTGVVTNPLKDTQILEEMEFAIPCDLPYCPHSADYAVGFNCLHKLLSCVMHRQQIVEAKKGDFWCNMGECEDTYSPTFVLVIEKI